MSFWFSAFTLNASKWKGLWEIHSPKHPRIAAIWTFSIFILCSLVGICIPHCHHLVIKLQIVLPPLLLILLPKWERDIFLKALIFEVIRVHLCLQGAAQVPLCFFFFFISLICSGFPRKLLPLNTRGNWSDMAGWRRLTLVLPNAVCVSGPKFWDLFFM